MGAFWKGLFLAIAVVVVVAIAALAWVQWRIGQETVTPVSVANAGGSTGKALLVYQPGLSSFTRKVTTAFAQGLVAAGWEVSTTTASSQAPAAVQNYDLIVLGSPVYGGAAAKPLTSYVERVADFKGKPVVIILTAAGAVDAAIEATQTLVSAAKGVPVRSLGLTTMRPNDEANKYRGSNTDRAIQIAREAGQTLKLPSP